MRTTRRGIRRITAGLLAAALLCVLPPAGHPDAADGDVKLTAKRIAPLPSFDSVTIRVEGLDDKDAFRLRAHANAALARWGLKPDIAAPVVLLMRVNQPLSWQKRGGSSLTIMGEGGSRSRTELGVGIELPLGGETEPPKPVEHQLTAELSAARADSRPVWRAEASIKERPDRSGDAAQRMADAVIAALARAQKAH